MAFVLRPTAPAWVSLGPVGRRPSRIRQHRETSATPDHLACPLSRQSAGQRREYNDATGHLVGARTREVIALGRLTGRPLPSRLPQGEPWNPSTVRDVVRGDQVGHRQDKP